MLEYMKLEPGQEGYLGEFPSMCICGSQKGPMADTGLEKNMYGHVYVCRSCVTRMARVLGLVKGDEMTRLQGAADELAVAAEEVATRQEIIDRMTRAAGENEAKINTQREFIEQLQGELNLRKAQANQIAAQAREMAAV